MEHIHEIIQGISRIDDILHDQDLFSFYRFIKILGDPDYAARLRPVSVASHAHKIHGNRNGDPLRQLTHEEYAALQDTDQMDLLSRIVSADLLSKLPDPLIHFFF